MRTRSALSDRFSVLDRGGINVFDAFNEDGSHAPLWFDEQLGIAYYAKLDKSRVIVDDIFTPEPFDGVTFLKGLPFAGEEVVFGCNPELLGLTLRTIPQPYAARDDRLQIRGQLIDPAVPIAWPTYSFM